MSELRALYQEIILEHNKNPRNFRLIPDASGTLEGYNPLCGDHYTIYLKTEGEIITDVAFQGSGCAISKASASVMTTLVKGKSVRDAQKLFDVFHELVTGASSDQSFERVGKLAAFAGVSEFPARVKCASLAWHTLRSLLEKKTQPVTTE